jgi:hypothetical protein
MCSHACSDSGVCLISSWSHSLDLLRRLSVDKKKREDPLRVPRKAFTYLHRRACEDRNVAVGLGVFLYMGLGTCQ